MFDHLLSTLQRIDDSCKALSRQVLDGVDQEVANIETDVMAFLDQLKSHIIQNPEPVFSLLRRIKPILVFKNFALVTRFEDVQEVLSRDDVFQVTYGPKMRIVTGGQDFFLGMQNTPAYTRDVSHMRSVVRREDIDDKIIPFVRTTAAQLVEAAGHQFDLVKDLSIRVPTRWVADYFGCPLPSENDVSRWATAIFQYLFVDLNNDPQIEKAAVEAAAKTRDWLDKVIASRKATPNSRDDVLGRCLALQKANLPGMDDVSIRNNLLGLLVGAIPTTSKCCAQALNELLDRPDQLRNAQEAAATDDDELMARYVFEALRFNPNNPGVFRIAAQDYHLAKGFLHGGIIPKGTTVIALTQSAMFDERIVEQPSDFSISRPAYLSMHFGYGLHTCFGQYINRAQIPGILKPVLKRPGLQRAGTLQCDGPFPASLPLRFN